jgi:ribonuclease E
VEGQVGSISDELAPPPAPEAAEAVADFDGGHAPASPLPDLQPETIATAPEAQHVEPQQPAAAPPDEEAEHEKPSPRRSTVREKVSFGTGSSPATETPAPVVHGAPESTPAPTPAPETSETPQPRKAGWWSRRFGGG